MNYKIVTNGIPNDTRVFNNEGNLVLYVQSIKWSDPTLRNDTILILNGKEEQVSSKNNVKAVIKYFRTDEDGTIACDPDKGYPILDVFEVDADVIYYADPLAIKI